MKSALRTEVRDGRRIQILTFVCPGCQKFGGSGILTQDAGLAIGGSGIHILPVNSAHVKPSWAWNGSLERPTLKPSIMTGRGTTALCHSYLTNGVFHFLGDCTHDLANQQVEMPDLPDWLFEQEVTGSEE